MTNVVEVVQNVSVVEVSAGARGPAGVTDEARIIRMDLFNIANSSLESFYSEFTFNVDDYITVVDVWEDSGKTTKLYTVTNTYDVSGLRTEREIVDEVNGVTLTITYVYDVDENIESKTYVYTET